MTEQTSNQPATDVPAKPVFFLFSLLTLYSLFYSRPLKIEPTPVKTTALCFSSGRDEWIVPRCLLSNSEHRTDHFKPRVRNARMHTLVATRSPIDFNPASFRSNPRYVKTNWPIYRKTMLVVDLLPLPTNVPFRREFLLPFCREFL